MFKFNELKGIHLEISNNCQAKCPMCVRTNNPLIKIQNWSIDDFKHIITPDVIKQVKYIYMSGNFGDPVMNNDLVKMCQHYATYADTQVLSINTNGSLRTEKWWANLVSFLPKNHKVVFAIDGLEDTNHLYRVDTNYKKIIKNASAFISNGGHAEWAFLKFKHNEHQVEDAKKLAISLGFKTFIYKSSTRFVLEPKIKVNDYYIEPPSTDAKTFITKDVIDNVDAVLENPIQCTVQEEKEIFIDAYKVMYPCCWTASLSHSYIQDDYTKNTRIRMLTELNTVVREFGGKDFFNLKKTSIEEVLDSTEYQTLWKKYWDMKKLLICARTCGKNQFSKPTDQYIEILKL